MLKFGRKQWGNCANLRFIFPTEISHNLIRIIAFRTHRRRCRRRHICLTFVGMSEAPCVPNHVFNAYHHSDSSRSLVLVRIVYGFDAEVRACVRSKRQRAFIVHLFRWTRIECVGLSALHFGRSHGGYACNKKCIIKLRRTQSTRLKMWVLSRHLTALRHCSHSPLLARPLLLVHRARRTFTRWWNLLQHV